MTALNNRLSNLPERTLAAPPEKEVAELIAILYTKMRLISESSGENLAMLEGCKEAIEILSCKKMSYQDISENLITDKGWIIALLAVDYLNGKCDQKIFEALPIR